MKASAVKGIIIGAAVGIATGIGAFTFIYAKGASYLTNDPKACANCHIMQDHYDAWLKSSHRSVAVCNDCHDPGTMQLRITRLGFIEGIKAVKASQGVKEYSVNLQATRQEMRTYVCAQCHVEYYFKGKEKNLVYPWQKGLKVEQILAYYDEVVHKDWNHAVTGAPVLKAQHPEFELWNQGVHARSGVSCADCHMPYKREGAHKISDHHVRSPLLNINRACQTCHNWPEQELRERVFANQGRTHDMRNLAMDALIEFINDVKTIGTNNIPEEQLKVAHDFQRKAQFYLDFVEAENSMGFHAPQEAVRILGESINFSRRPERAARTAKGGGDNG